MCYRTPNQKIVGLYVLRIDRTNPPPNVLKSLRTQEKHPGKFVGHCSQTILNRPREKKRFPDSQTPPGQRTADGPNRETPPSAEVPDASHPASAPHPGGRRPAGPSQPARPGDAALRRSRPPSGAGDVPRRARRRTAARWELPTGKREAAPASAR